MNAEIVCLATEASQETVQQWLDGLCADRDNGLLPPWIGAVVLTVRDEKAAHLAFISKEQWLMVRMAFQHGLN